ncbi:MAG TPA: ATP-binding cassette domain-containing protein [Solirubrobacteraceae bacterium]|jgi:ABC-type lipoprotein export system ATPase subunit|nr:ATP-binding cassette domain-containing protein [Solirubrobacteraceae bacterium]
MTLLELHGVAKRYREGQLERVVLREVSLRIDAGELAMVWGVRGAGRSTLLRVAAGIEAPDEGVVRFEGRELSGHGGDVLGAGIGYCQKLLRGGSQLALEVVTMPLLAAGVSPACARTRACEALERAGAPGCATLRAASLDTAETVRVALARVLAHDPRLVVIDDPIQGVDLFERDGILALLRSLTGEGVAVLASTTDATGLAGADRTLTLSEGELRGPPQQQLAPVLALRRPAGWRASA